MDAGLKRFNLVLILCFTGFSMAFLFLLDSRPYGASWLVKTIPIACLALFAFKNFTGVRAWLMTLGFSFSALGDVLLELPHQGLFQAGMGAFILAHISYTALFMRKPGLVLSRGIVMTGMIAAVLTFGFFLFPKLGDMVIPILVYLVVILLMGISACAGRENNGLIIAGAGLFILSDSLIAYTMFAAPIPFSSFWVMTTYYAAQALLASGVYQYEQHLYRVPLA